MDAEDMLDDDPYGEGDAVSEYLKLISQESDLFKSNDKKRGL